MRKKKDTRIPVIALFVVLCGLGKEFSRETYSNRKIKHRIYFSIIHDPHAYHTLELQSTFYQFKEDKVPASRNRKDSLVGLRGLTPCWLTREWRVA